MTLLERDPNAPPVWKGAVPVINRYTYGLAGERFFRAIKEQGTILGTYCNHCMHTYVPAATFCERCLNELVDWIDVGTIGEIVTYTLLSIQYDGSPQTSPDLVAFIQLSDGGLIHHRAERKRLSGFELAERADQLEILDPWNGSLIPVL